jgi:ribosomal protein S18 acetylase RimI-like enzyme
MEQLMLGVVASNDKARSLYSRLRFQEYGRLEKYFKSGDEYETLLLLKLTKYIGD